MSIYRRMVLADTGPLFAIIDPRDQHHRQAHEELDVIYADGWSFGVTWTTVAETYSLLLKRIGPLSAQEWIEDLSRDFLIIPVSPNDYLAAIDHVRQFGDQQFTLFDAIVYVVSEHLGMSVWAFDHHFDVMRARRWHPA